MSDQRTIDPASSALVIDETGHDDHDHDEHDRGLQHDLATMGASAASAAGAIRSRVADGLATKVDRRRLLGIAGGGAAALALAACIPVTGGGYAAINEETEGPYPGDGSNGPNVLTTSGVVRRDLKSSFGSFSGSATGVPLTLRMRATDVSDGGNPKAGLAIYAWHCDSQGRYSLYSNGVTDQNWLRGVQVTDANGWVRFDTIWPGCYDGRWPHIHFEVYPSAAKATSAANKLRTSQIAMPAAQSKAVYATSNYPSSAANLAKTSLSTDGVFRDGWTHQLAEVSGSVTNGYTAVLTFAVP